MTRSIPLAALITLTSALFLNVAKVPAATPELKVIATFNTGGAGRWDYPTVDADARRLYVARKIHMQVIDLDKRVPLGDVANLQGAHGTAMHAADQKLGFATSGRENAVAVFDLENFSVSQKISTTLGGHGQNPDAILYDPASKKVFAFCAGGDAVVIDPANLSAPAVAINCGGKLEFGQWDGAGHVFVNCEDKNEIVVIDSRELKVLAHWPIAPATGPSGLAIDTAHHRLFSVGSNQKMAIVDSENGKLLATVPIGKGVDGCISMRSWAWLSARMAATARLRSSAKIASGAFSSLQTLTTLKSGRTIANDPKTSQFLIPATVPSASDGAMAFGIVVVGAAQ